MSVLFSEIHNTILCYDRRAKQIRQCTIPEILGGNSFVHLRPIELVVQGGRGIFYVNSNGRHEITFSQDGKVFDHEKSIEFEIHRLNKDSFALSNISLFLCAENDGGVSISRKRIGAWETFRSISGSSLFKLIVPRLPYVFPELSKTQIGRILVFQNVKPYGRVGYFLNNARVLSTDWTVFAPGGFFSKPDMSHFQRMNRSLGDCNFIALPKLKYLKIDIACLVGSHYNYYHNLIDYMINFFAIDDVVGQDIPLLVGKETKTFQKQIIELFGFKNRIVELDVTEFAKISRLVVPPKAVIGDGVVCNPEIIKRCNKYLRGLIVDRSLRNRIFISRSKTAVRTASNEAEACDIAKEYGFHIVVLEEMTFREQVQLFLYAEAVAGLHGAGFSNIIFCPHNCKILEIYPVDGVVPNAFKNLSKGLGLQYSRSLASGGQYSTSVTIDLLSFSDALKKIFNQEKASI